MKSNRLNRYFATVQVASVSIVVSALFGLSASLGHSASLTWDIAPGTVGAGNGAITGGVGIWDTTPSLGNWTADGGATNVAWVNNITPDGAIFQGTGGVVTQAGVVVNNLTFSTTGYSVTGGTLTLGGASPKITATADATMASIMAGSAGLIKDGAGILTISTQATYTGNTTVNAGILSLGGGGGSAGTIRGSVDVNSGATLRFSTGDATGYGTGTDGLKLLNINTGGTLNVAVTANQTLGNGVINLTGGSITGVAGSNLDFFQTTSALNSLASPVTSTVSGTRLSIRQAAGITMNVAQGSTPSGIDLDINSAIASNGTFATAPLIKTGLGTLRLNGINILTGATIINAGRLTLGGGGTATTSDFTVNSGGTLRLANTGKTLKSLALNAGSTFNTAASKSATTTVTDALGTAGAITIKPEFLDLPMTSDVYNLATAASATGTPAFTVDTSTFGATRVAGTAAMVGNVLKLTVTTGAADLIWTNNASTSIWNLNTDANFTNGGSPDVFKSFDSVTFSGTAPGTVTLAGMLYPSAVNVTSAVGDYTFAGSGSIAGGALNKSGAAALTITNANSPGATNITGGILNANVASAISGVTTVNGGTLNLGNAAGLGNGALVLNSGTIDNTTGAEATVANPQTWNGSFAFTGTQNLTTTGTVALTGNSQISVNAGSLISNGVISGAFNLTKAGAGTLQLGAADTFTGSTNVTGGRLFVTAGGTLRNSSGFNVGSGATLELGATNILVTDHGTPMANTRVITVTGGTLLMNTLADFRFGNVTLNDGATWTSNRGLAAYDSLLANTSTGAATVTVGGTGPSVMNGTGGIHLQGVQNFSVADTTASAAPDLNVNMILGNQGTIGGDLGGVHKIGAGTMVLNRDNLYSGATIVDGGRLTIGSTGSINPSDITVNAATFQVNTTGKFLNSLTANAGSTLALPAKKLETTSVANALTTAGAVTLQPVFLDVPAPGDSYDLLTAGTFVNGATYSVDLSSFGTTRVTGTAVEELGRILVLKIGTGAAQLVWSNGAATGNWNLNTDANFKNGASADVFKTFDAVTFGNTAAGNVNLVGTLYPSSVTVNSTSNYTFAGAGTLGGGALVKDGTSTLNLNIALSPSSVTLMDGTLNVANPGAVGNGNIALMGGAFNNGTGAALVLANPQSWETTANFTGSALTISGNVTVFGQTDVNVGASGLTVSGSINGSGGVLAKKGAGTLTMNGATGSTLSSGLDVDAGTLALTTASGASSVTVGTKTDAASVVVDGNQNFNRFADLANIQVGAMGTMTLNGVNSLPNAAGAVNITVDAGGVLNIVSGGSTLTGAAGASHNHIGNLILGGGTVNLSYSGTGTAYNGESAQLDGNLDVGGSTPSTIQYGTGATQANAGLALSAAPVVPHTITVADVTGNAAADLVIKAELENSDGGAGGFTKLGAGTMMLADAIAHSYTGTTTVTAGTLAGTGSIAGPLVVEAGGTIAPGASAGSLGTGAATISGTYACEINGNSADNLVITGDLTISNGTLQISVLGGGVTQATYVIASYTGNRLGEFTISPALPTGYTVKYDDVLKQVQLTNGAASSTYNDWIASFPGAQSAPGFTQDPDLDGIANGIENVLGTNPSVSSTGLYQVSATANSVTFLHTLNADLADDVVYGYEWSSDLVEWKASTVANSAGTIATIVPSAPVSGVVTVVATRSGTPSTKLFVRIVAIN